VGLVQRGIGGDSSRGVSALEGSLAPVASGLGLGGSAEATDVSSTSWPARVSWGSERAAVSGSLHSGTSSCDLENGGAPWRGSLSRFAELCRGH